MLLYVWYMALMSFNRKLMQVLEEPLRMEEFPIGVTIAMLMS
jgi:hypothetical protein